MPIDNKVDIDTSGPEMDVDIPEENNSAEIEQPEVKEEPTVRPVVEEKLENEIEQELKDITKIHFKKMEDKEKWLEKKIEDNILEFKKIEEKQKEIKSQLDKQKN